jgi:putative transposase
MPGFPRLASHDYRQPGVCFVTAVTWQRCPLFGRLRNGRAELSPEGAIVTVAWLGIPQHFPSVTLDAFIVMPDHFHQIVNLFKGDATRAIRAGH